MTVPSTPVISGSLGVAATSNILSVGTVVIGPCLHFSNRILNSINHILFFSNPVEVLFFNQVLLNLVIRLCRSRNLTDKMHNLLLFDVNSSGSPDLAVVRVSGSVCLRHIV